MRKTEKFTNKWSLRPLLVCFSLTRFMVQETAGLGDNVLAETTGLADKLSKNDRFRGKLASFNYWF